MYQRPLKKGSSKMDRHPRPRGAIRAAPAKAELASRPQDFGFWTRTGRQAEFYGATTGLSGGFAANSAPIEPDQSADRVGDYHSIATPMVA